MIISGRTGVPAILRSFCILQKKKEKKKKLWYLRGCVLIAKVPSLPQPKTAEKNVVDYILAFQLWNVYSQKQLIYLW